MARNRLPEAGPGQCPLYDLTMCGPFSALQRGSDGQAAKDKPQASSCAQPNVRFGSKADICSAKRHVRFTPESGH